MPDSEAGTPEAYRRALDRFDQVITAVPGDRWAAPSPCEAWTARDVAGHVIGGQHLVRAMATGQDPPDVHTDPARFTYPDPVTAWRAARDQALAVLTPKALEQLVMTRNFGEVNLRGFVSGFVLDLTAHTWDLAQAAGQPVRLDPDIVAQCLADARQREAMLRRPGLLGPATAAPAGADPQTQLMAFLGRKV